MDTQLEKSITSVIVFGENSKADYEFVQNYPAKIMMNGAYEDKRHEPEHIAIYHLSWSTARMIIDFSLGPELEKKSQLKGVYIMQAFVGIRSQ